MARFRKKPVVIEAAQWEGHGEFEGDPFPMVRYYRRPEGDGQKPCKHCGVIMHNHGWIDTLESGHVVCPNDWIITGVKGEYYPCKPDIFEDTYEPVTDDG